MNTKTENCQLNSELTLNARSQSPLTVHAVTLSLTKQDNEIIECRLTLKVNPEYRRIDTEVLFNLKPEVRNPLSAGEFLLENDIKIETSLKPDLLPAIANFFKDWTETNLSTVTQKATSQTLDGMTNFFNELAGQLALIPD